MTSHNYLFAQTDNDAALTRLIATAATATGFMKGAPGAALPGWYRPGENNGAFLTSLYQKIEATYPEAGQPFYAMRLWTNLIWQPCYLAVIGAHLHGGVPELGTLSQAMRNIHVDGYRLPAAPQFRGALDAMIARAGADLRHYADAVLKDINAVTKLKRVPALRMLGDHLLGLMKRLRHYQPDICVEEQQRCCVLWQAAMGLENAGGLEVIDLPDGRAFAIMACKGCCLDYLAMPGTYCDCCPRQKKDVRLARQRASAIAEMEMRED
ncbi:siderophore ferric iron reductase [Devosia faecipullorum]|uniref:siderophore ferric iron reductase n=1 Tax=Devosia faecipullorum TaxID=2755039 RepID=UPI00187B7682|nr:siderophore ferric iron reductase [Devosia faecipullorum]